MTSTIWGMVNLSNAKPLKLTRRVDGIYKDVVIFHPMLLVSQKICAKR